MILIWILIWSHLSSNCLKFFTYLDLDLNYVKLVAIVLKFCTYLEHDMNIDVNYDVWIMFVVLKFCPCLDLNMDKDVNYDI